MCVQHLLCVQNVSVWNILQASEIDMSPVVAIECPLYVSIACTVWMRLPCNSAFRAFRMSVVRCMSTREQPASSISI